MKAITCSISFVVLFIHILVAQSVANSLIPKIDNRVELLSIVFKLAGAKDFSDTLNPIYSKAILNHFGRYAHHPAISHARELMDSLQIKGIDFGYWDIPGLAVHLSQPAKLDPIVSFNDEATDDGWDNRSLVQPKLIRLLKAFYKDADCEVFFKSQAKYYDEIQQQYDKNGIKINREWIENFFSLAPSENYYAILGLCLRDGAYLRVNYPANHRDTFTVFGCTSFDEKGIPSTFSNQMFPRSMLHEYIHAFTNQVIDKNIKILQKPAETILANPEVFKLMENTFYGNSQYLLYESIVRACFIRYVMANPEMESTIEKEISIQEKAGFFWMKGLVEELGVYERSRKTYKNLEAFMPRLNKYFEKVASEIKKIN